MKNFISTVLLLCLFQGAFASFISQRNWRWRSDDGTEAKATWKASEMNSITISDLNPLRLRIELNNSTKDSINYDKAIEFTTNPKIGPWKRVGVVGNNEFMLIGKSGFVADSIATTQQLDGSSSNPFVAGQEKVNSEENYHFLKANTKTEYEWVLKPTEHVEKNTTYYFRTPVGDYPVALPSLTTSGDIPCKTRLVSNGSFESDSSGWKNTVSDGGTVSFGINNVDSVVHSGYKSLKASVTALGTKESSVQTATTFDASQDSIHLLQFWARSSVDMADLVAVIIDGKDTTKCHFKIRTGWYTDATTPKNSHGGWYQYHFPFKAKSASAILKFYYRVASDFYIDDVEVIDQSNGNGSIDVYTTYMWHHNRKGYGWYNADNDISVNLPDGRVAWFFNDTFLGMNNPFDNVFVGDKFVRNAMVVQDKNKQLTPMYSAAGGNKNTYFIPVHAAPLSGFTNLYWVADGFVEADKLKELLVEVEYDAKSKNAATQGSGRNYLATFDLATLALEKIDRMPSGYDYENILDDGEYYYMYGVETSGLSGYTKVARAKKGDFIGSSTPWQFYNLKHGWFPVKDSASRVCPYWANAVKKLGQGNYAMVNSDAMSSQEKVTFAPTPVGPWTRSILLYQVPNEVNYWNYMPNIHDDLYTAGKYTVSYSVNCYESWGPAYNDKYFYWPRYIQADLLKLSPFTGRSNKTVESGKTYKLIARHSNKALHLDSDGITIGQAALNSNTHQLWTITDVGEGFYKIVEAGSGKALGIKNGLMENGNILQLDSYSSENNQKWSIDSIDNKYFRLINKNSGKALEIAASDTVNGAKADQWDYQSKMNQQWVISKDSLTTATAIYTDLNNSRGSIELYPNPVAEMLYVNGLDGNAELKIFTLQGVKVKEYAGMSIDVSALISGTYLLNITIHNRVQTKLFVKH